MMRKLYILALTLLSAGAYGQIQQDINKNGGTTESNPINDVDSIRFNSGSTEMEVILNNGSMESHTISDIDNVTFSGSLVGIITNLDCNNANLIGTLEEGTAASGVSVDVDYTGGNGGAFTGQSITSTGVTGLTAQLSGGNFANGAGTLTFAISGTPASAGTATFPLNIGGQSCNLELNVSGTAVGTINSLDCGNANTIGTLEEGTAAAGVSIDVDYTGGNGGAFTGQSITSTGVTGLTAQLSGGNFANGAGTLTYAISGTPASAGTATFSLNIGGQTCNLDVTVDAATPTYPPGYVHCGTPTAIVEVTNPNTGEIWMDRNLGASQVATSSTDTDAYGDLFQWGRFADGHQCRTSNTTSTLSTTDTPGHGDFITTSAGPNDWRSPQNDNLWQGVSGINNPCPTGYRLPTEAEWQTELNDWSNASAAGAFTSPLKLPLGGDRAFNGGTISNVGTQAFYWSSTIGAASDSRYLFFMGGFSDIYAFSRAAGFSVRCIKD